MQDKNLSNKIIIPNQDVNLTHRFVKIRQRDGSGTAKKLEEPIATAPSGFFSATGHMLLLYAVIGQPEWALRAGGNIFGMFSLHAHACYMVCFITLFCCIIRS